MNEIRSLRAHDDPASLASLREIEKEHALIRGLLQKLEMTREIELLLGELRRLEPLLRKHFEAEEAPGGLYAVIQEQAQGSFHRLERLSREHVAFLASVRELEEMIRQCLEGPVAEVRRRVCELVTQIRAHESRETDVLSESLSTDQGALD